jgi:hypothetical protein
MPQGLQEKKITKTVSLRHGFEDPDEELRAYMASARRWAADEKNWRTWLNPTMMRSGYATSDPRVEPDDVTGYSGRPRKQRRPRTTSPRNGEV